MKLISSFKYNSNAPLLQISEKGYLATSKGSILGIGKGNPEFYDLQGKRVWKNKEQLVIADRINDIAICFKPSKQDTYIGYQMSTGNKLWETNITSKMHDIWCKYLPLKKSNYIYLIGDALTRLDIATGNTITRPFRAGVKEPMKSRFSIASRTKAPSFDFAREMSFAKNAGILSGTHSNWIVKGDSMFIADADSIYCLTRDLKTIWQTALPKDLGAYSTISISSNQVKLLNYGVAFQNGIIGKYGMPFAATVDINNGKQISITYPQIDKKIIGGYYADGGRIYWQTKSNFYYSTEGDSAVTKIKYKPNSKYQPSDYHPDFLIADTIGIVKDGYMTPAATNSNQLVVELFGKDANNISINGETEYLPADKIYLHDSGNVYSTNVDEDKPNNFIIIDPKTKKIKYTFNLKGHILQDNDENILIKLSEGIGFIPKSN